MIEVLSECGPAQKLAGRQGVSPAVLRNPNKGGHLSLKPHNARDLDVSDSFAGFRPFVSVFRMFPAQ